MSQGARLVQTLHRLGYPKANELHGDCFDWVFEHDAIVPFLEWFCDNIQPANVVSHEDLQRFEKLVSSGDGVLEGEALHQALQGINSNTDESLEGTDLRDEIAATRQCIASTKQQLQKLVYQRNKLGLHHTEQAQKLSTVGHVEKDAKQSYRRCLEQTQADNRQMNRVLDQLAKAVSDLTALCSCPGESGPAYFLSQLEFKDYYQAEESFTTDLTAYTKKQFFKGIAEMAGRDKKYRYELLEISQPSDLLIRGEPEDVTLGDCKELQRLQAVYSMSERRRIDSMATARGLAAAVQTAERMVRQFTAKEQQPVADTSSLSEQMQQVQSRLSAVKREIGNLRKDDVPALLEELAVLQGTKILRGDYDLKIARQDYFTSKQDQVIKQLMLQRSRYEFLAMALEVEGHRHRDTHRLFSTVDSALRDNITGLQARSNVMSEPSFNAGNPSRGTIDSRDKFIERLYRVLGDSSQETGNELFLTYSQLIGWSKKLTEHVDTLQIAVDAADHRRERTQRQLEHTAQQYEKTVYGLSATSAGLPQLNPQRLAESLSRLKEVLTTLEQSIKDLIKDCEAKKKILRSDSLKSMERDLFVYFFNDPTRLRRVITELKARVDAHIVAIK